MLFGGSKGLFLAYFVSFLFIVISYIIFFEKKLNLAIFKKRILYLVLLFFITISIYNISGLLEFFSSFFARNDGLEFQESYRFQQLSCLISSIFQNGFFGSGPGSSPLCWDLYSEGVTRSNQLELEYFNLLFQYGFIYIFYSFYIFFISINYLGFCFQNKYDRVMTFVPVCLMLIAFFTSFTNGSLLSINTQLLMCFASYLSFNPLKK
jgi:hypothetical protein